MKQERQRERSTSGGYADWLARSAEGGVSRRKDNRIRHKRRHGIEKKSEEGDIRNKGKTKKRKVKTKRRGKRRTAKRKRKTKKKKGGRKKASVSGQLS